MGNMFPAQLAEFSAREVKIQTKKGQRVTQFAL